MARVFRLGVVSDIHYASAAERSRGGEYELSYVRNPFLRLLLKSYRRFFWLRDPLDQNYLVEKFLARADHLDFLIANGDYSCDTAALGVSDDAACQSVRECLGQLRLAFPGKFRAILGDHELGKLSFFGERGGMRLRSFHRAAADLGLEPFWQLRVGRYCLIGVASSLIALPALEQDTLPEERQEWYRLREEHLARLGRAFGELSPEIRVLLFCHDPTALPFLSRERPVAEKLEQIEHTIIGHLHSNLILWKSRWLAGMPRLSFLGHTPRRLSEALRQAREWRPFNVRLCPSLAGIELLKDGGFLVLELDPEAQRPARLCVERIARAQG